jgi:hypothetical protein
MLSKLRVGVPVVLALLLAGGFLLGQDAKKAEEPAPKLRGTLPRNFKKLGLDEAQIRAIYKVQSTYSAKIDALAQQIRNLRAEEAGEIEKVLTDAQKSRLKELKLGETTKTADADKKPTAEKTEKKETPKQ